MALNISIFVIPLPVFLAALVLIIAAMIVLTVVEKRLGRKAKVKKEYEETYYQKKLSATTALQYDPNGFLISLDKVAREFFSEEMGFKTMGKYSQLIDGLAKKQMFREAAFCQKMQEALYSGEVLSQTLLYSLHDQMRAFVLKRERRELKEIKPKQEIIPPRNIQPRAIQVSEVEINNNILRYMGEGRKRGFEIFELKKKLLASGFDEAEINEAEKHLSREIDKPKMVPITEKRILTSFFNPQNRDLEIIKKGVEEKDEIGRAEIIEIVPYRKEELPKKEVKYPLEEPESYRRVRSLDDLERVKNKIDSKRKNVAAG